MPCTGAGFRRLTVPRTDAMPVRMLRPVMPVPAMPVPVQVDGAGMRSRGPSLCPLRLHPRQEQSTNTQAPLYFQATVPLALALAALHQLRHPACPPGTKLRWHWQHQARRQWCGRECGRHTCIPVLALALALAHQQDQHHPLTGTCGPVRLLLPCRSQPVQWLGTDAMIITPLALALALVRPRHQTCCPSNMRAPLAPVPVPVAWEALAPSALLLLLLVPLS